MAKRMISIIPGGCLQFVDASVDLSEGALSRLRKPFREEPGNDAHNQAPAQNQYPGQNPNPQDMQGRSAWNLYPLVWDAGLQQHVHRINQQPAELSYEVDAKQAFSLFDGQWIPVPFLCLKPERWDDQEQKFERGPSNWARIRVKRRAPETRSPESRSPETRTSEGHASNPNFSQVNLSTSAINGEHSENNSEKGQSNLKPTADASDEQHIYDITLAFDTTVETRQAGSQTYHALSRENVAENGLFRFAHHERDNAWFLNEGWVDAWLEGTYNTFRQMHPKFKLIRAASFASPTMEYMACYLTLLEALHLAGVFPDIKVSDPGHVAPIGVDLVLDLGNSRMTGLLVETIPQRPTSLNDSYLLQIRDLSSPEKFYAEPIETRVEFSEVTFGNTRLSARSGRQTPAFIWPSPVRVGPEAARLCAQAKGAEGSTGMSSPKRYLWDERPRMQQWRYNGEYADGQIEPPVTRGVFIQHVNKEGTPLSCLTSANKIRYPSLRNQQDEVAFEARFTRSSLMMFLISEVIMQALVTINSPQVRGGREYPDIPRHLQRIILTVPTAMPIAEQKIYQRWANWAVGLVWDCLGWNNWYQHKPRLNQPSPHAGSSGAYANKDYRTSPEVRCDWDEATCTQIVYLYNELAEKFQGDATQLFNIMGRVRTGYSGPSLRVASIDMGGGTTDLSITTYEVLGGESTSARIKPNLEFRDGFNIAGDDILNAVIKTHVLGAIRNSLQNSGVPDVRNLLGSLFKDSPGQTQQDRMLRGQWIRQIAMPVGLGILEAYEKANLQAGNASFTCKIGNFLKARGLPDQKVIAYVEKPLQEAQKRAGVEAVGLLDFELTLNLHEVDRTVRQTIGQILADLCEVVHMYGCDLLLLTGRPSCWPAMADAPLAKLPLPPDRIIPMHEYRVGNWYPFANSMGSIEDPKTTVVVGAIICALSEGHLEGFSFDTTSLRLKSTARYIGELDKNGQLLPARVWFEADVDNPNEVELKRTVEFNTPMAVGFRQLAASRWTTTRLYSLEYANQEAIARAKNTRPYKLTLSFTMREIDQEAAIMMGEDHIERDEGELSITEVERNDGSSGQGDIVIRLQTLSEEEGYWLDTGLLENI